MWNLYTFVCFSSVNLSLMSVQFSGPAKKPWEGSIKSLLPIWHSCNHHHNQRTDRFHHTRRLPCAPLQSVPCPSSPTQETHVWSCHLRLQSGVYGGYHFVSGVFCSANCLLSMSLSVSIVHFCIAKSEPILWIFYHFSSIHLLVDIYQPNFGATFCCNSLPPFPLISFYSENREGDISPELIFFYEFLG